MKTRALVTFPQRILTGVILALGLLQIAPTAKAIHAASGVFTVDATAPDVPVAVTPTDGATVNAWQVKLQSAADDATSGVAAYQFEIDSEISDWINQSAFYFLTPENGTHQWRCRAKDYAGNRSDWSPLQSFNFLLTADGDHDGLPDSWELTYFGRLDYTDGTRDSDGDGWSDQEEYTNQTNPFEFYLNLKTGWNLLALPFDATADGMAALTAATAPVRWTWNGKSYDFTPLPAAYQGFWVYATEEQSNLPVSGLPPQSTEYNLLAGWNLTGAGSEVTIPDSAILRVIWDWSSEGYSDISLTAQPRAKFKPFRGYWIYSSGGLLNFAAEN